MLGISTGGACFSALSRGVTALGSGEPKAGEGELYAGGGPSCERDCCILAQIYHPDGSLYTYGTIHGVLRCNGIGDCVRWEENNSDLTLFDRVFCCLLNTRPLDLVSDR
jgi:hypothetical protein